MKIWHQSMTELEIYPEYGEILESHARRVLDPSIEVVMHGLTPGTHGGVPPARSLYSPYAYHVLLRQVIEHFATAEDEGYDAVVIGSYSEPFLREARAAVDIPVVSMAESTLLTACSIATYAVLVTMSPEIAWMISQIVASHHLTERITGVDYLDPGMDETALAAAFDDPTAFVQVFSDTARRGISRFGDVIIPAEGIMNEILVAHEINEIDGVSVMDSTAVAWLHADYMVRLQRATKLHPGRRWDYARLAPERMAAIRDQDRDQGAARQPDRV